MRRLHFDAMQDPAVAGGPEKLQASGVTFVTLSDSCFFPGVAALVNSLRLTGNEGDVAVVDFGMTPEERSALEPHARVQPLPEALAADPLWATNPWISKPAAAAVQTTGIVVMIDSDMIVTASLDRAIAAARDGKIFVYRDPPRPSWFPEWEQILDLEAPIRRSQTYVNGGFVAFSADAWPDFLPRLRELCGQIPPDMVAKGQQLQAEPAWLRPFATPGQDSMNALLMSEIPAEAVEIGPIHDYVDWNDMRRVEVVDLRRLVCRYEGKPVRILHHTFSPKVWQPGSWRRFRHDDAYAVLVSRLLLGDDVPVRVDPGRLPLWLRSGLGPTLAAHGISRFMDIGNASRLFSTTRPLRHAVRRRLRAAREANPA
jgi:hypothetical protein